MRLQFATILLLSATLLGSGVVAAPFSGGDQCSEECVRFILSDSTGPKVLRLYKELLKPDSGSTIPVTVNGQSYPVSYSKKTLIDNAVRKGVPETTIESMLDDAAILPSGPATTTSRQTQQTIERPNRLEPVRERRPAIGGHSDGGSYKIFTKTNGDINIEINGHTLKVPDDLPRLPQIVDDTDTVVDIIRQLQSLGVPVKRDGNRVSVGSPQSPQGISLRVSIRKIDDKPSSVTVQVNDDKYTLPGVADEFRLNRFLQKEPEVAYHLLRILSSHGVPVEYDARTKTLKTQLSGETTTGDIGSRTTIPERHSSHRPSSSTSSSDLITPSASQPKILRVGTTSYYLPEDWDRLKRDMQDGKVSATSVLDILEMQHIAAPGDVISLIRTRISSSISKVRVMRYGDDVTVELGSQTFKLPKDERDLERALRENEFPIELIRDSLLRIGIDSRRVGSTLRVMLPGGEAYLTGLPVTRQYDYKVTSRPGGVQVVAGSDTYNLPADRILIERAIADKKVLPRTLVDAFNSVGIPSEMDINKQEMTIDLTSGVLRIPVPLNVQQRSAGKRVALKARGPEGNRVYIFTIGEDSENDKIELPSQIFILSDYIRSGKVDANLVLQLLGRMNVAHYLDSANDVHKVTINGKNYELPTSPSTSGGSHRAGHLQHKV